MAIFESSEIEKPYEIFTRAIITEVNVNDRTIADNRKYQKNKTKQTFVDPENHQTLNIFF